MAKEILCGFGVDVDAVAGWLGSYGGEDSPDDISRGLFAGEVGSPRLLKLFARLGIKTTWFIPGHSIETFPAAMKAVAEAGHEIGIHGYSHENPIAMTREQEMAVSSSPPKRRKWWWTISRTGMADTGHFEFRSPHQPPRRIPVSETGYRSHFAAMDDIEATDSPQEYARNRFANAPSTPPMSS